MNKYVDFQKWLQQAVLNDTFIYYKGFLAEDIGKITMEKEVLQYTRTVLRLAERGVIAVVDVVVVEGAVEGDGFAISKPMTTLWHCYGIAILMLKKKGAELKQTRELKNN